MSAPNENPYQAPATVAAGLAPDFPPPKRIRLFGTPMVLLAGLLCTPLPALVMLAINCRRLGWRALMWGMVAAGVVALGLSVAPILFDFSNVGLGGLFLAQYLPLIGASMWIWHRTKKSRIRASYRYTSYGFAILVAFVAFVPVLLFTIVATVFLYLSRGTPVELAGGHECFISGDATEDDALFVGRHLDAEGYLPEGEGSTWFLNRAGGQYTLSLAVDPVQAGDPDLPDSLRNAGEELADLRLGRPLVVRAVDEMNRRVYWRTTIEPEGDGAQKSPET